MSKQILRLNIKQSLKEYMSSSSKNTFYCVEFQVKCFKRVSYFEIHICIDLVTLPVLCLVISVLYIYNIQLAVKKKRHKIRHQ